MTKSELTSYVRRVILGSEAVADNQKTAHYQRVAQGVNYAFDMLLAQIGDTRKGKAEIESYYVKHYYAQPVLESNSYRYVGVSDDIVPVAGGNGVWYVQPSKNKVNPVNAGVNFARSQRPKMAIFGSLPVGEVLNETFWRLGNITDNKQIVFENIGNSPFTDIRYVDYGIVRAFSSYDDTENVFMPDGRVDLLVELVRNHLGNVANDLVNNNE